MRKFTTLRKSCLAQSFAFYARMFGTGSTRLRAETRHRLKEELKRVIQTAHRVKHWEKKWVNLPDTNLLVYKWVPIANTDDKVGASPGSQAKRSSSQTGIYYSHICVICSINFE